MKFKPAWNSKEAVALWLAPDRRNLFERKKQYLKISKEIIQCTARTKQVQLCVLTLGRSSGSIAKLLPQARDQSKLHP